MSYINNSLLYSLAHEIVDFADRDFRDVECDWMAGRATQQNKSFLGVDNGKIYWQYTAEVRFAFGFLQPDFLIYWGAKADRYGIMTDADCKIKVGDDLAKLGERQLALAIKDYILGICRRKYPNYEMTAQCQYEEILRSDKGLRLIDDEEEPVIEDHFCCDIWVRVKKICSESSSSY